MTTDNRAALWIELAHALGVPVTGFAQVAEWARAYVENETGIPEMPEARLSLGQRNGLALLAEIEAELFE